MSDAVARTGSPPEPFRRHHVSTSDPELAAEVLRESYRISGGVTIADVTDQFHLAQERVDGDDVSVTRFRAAATIGYRGPLDGVLCVDQVHAGRLEIETARDRLHTGAGDVCLVPPHDLWRASTEDVDLAPLVLDRERVATYAAELSGIDAESLTFHGLEPISAAAADLWKATVAHVRDDVLGNDEIATAPLVRAETFRALATCVLSVFPNDAVDALGQRPAHRTRGAEPATIRRAAGYIDANAHRPIGIADIADAARIGARGLQYNFRRYRGCTPLEYLRRVRLAAAHQDLLAGDPTRGDTVTAIAARWGFSNPGRFSVEYRSHYGRSPRETLQT